MRELPEEILLHIFEVLAHQRPSTRFLLPVLQVCGLWKRIAQDLRFRHLVIPYQTGETSAIVEALCQMATEETTLDSSLIQSIEFLEFLGDDAESKPLHFMDSLEPAAIRRQQSIIRTLAISSEARALRAGFVLPGSILDIIGSQLVNLQSLTVEIFTGNQAAAVSCVQHLRHLRKLFLRTLVTGFVAWHGLHIPAWDLPFLHTLSYHDRTRIHDDGIMPFIERSRMEHLESLSFYYDSPYLGTSSRDPSGITIGETTARVLQSRPWKFLDLPLSECLSRVTLQDLHAEVIRIRIDRGNGSLHSLQLPPTTHTLILTRICQFQDPEPHIEAMMQKLRYVGSALKEVYVGIEWHKDYKCEYTKEDWIAWPPAREFCRNIVKTRERLEQRGVDMYDMDGCSGGNLPRRKGLWTAALEWT